MGTEEIMKCYSRLVVSAEPEEYSMRCGFWVFLLTLWGIFSALMAEYNLQRSELFLY